MIALGKIDNRESTDKEIPEAIKKFLYWGIAIPKNEATKKTLVLKGYFSCFGSVQYNIALKLCNKLQNFVITLFSHSNTSV